VKQVVARVTQRAIQRLTATYLTLSLQEVAAAVGLQGGAAEAEEALLRWAAGGLGLAGCRGLAEPGCWRAGLLCAGSCDACRWVGLGPAWCHSTHAPPPHSPARARRMIDAGDIRAAISGRDGMVRFHEEDPARYSGGALAEELDGALRRCMALAQRAQAVDAAVGGCAWREVAGAVAGAGRCWARPGDCGPR
jgi:hypothetical protein